MNRSSQSVRRGCHGEEAISGIRDKLKLAGVDRNNRLNKGGHRPDRFHQRLEMRVESVHFVLGNVSSRIVVNRCHIKGVDSFKPRFECTTKPTQCLCNLSCFGVDGDLRDDKYVSAHGAHGLLRILRRGASRHKLHKEADAADPISKFDELSCKVLHRSSSNRTRFLSSTPFRPHNCVVGCKRCKPASDATENCGRNGPGLPPRDALLSQPPTWSKRVQHAHSSLIDPWIGRHSAMAQCREVAEHV